MTLNEIFKANGLSDEQVEAISKSMKDNKIFTAAEENLDVRYGKLKAENDALKEKHGESTKLIESLKSETQNSETLQSKIAEYELAINQLQTQITQKELESAIKIALLEANAADIDYMTFKLKEKGELTLDDNGKIVGIDDMLSGLKTQFPAQFVSETAKQVDVQRLEDSTEPQPALTKAEFLKKSYKERADFAQENPEAYSELMGH